MLPFSPPTGRAPTVPSDTFLGWFSCKPGTVLSLHQIPFPLLGKVRPWTFLLFCCDLKREILATQVPAEQSDFPPQFVMFLLWCWVQCFVSKIFWYILINLIYFDILWDPCAGVMSEFIWQPTGNPPLLFEGLYIYIFLILFWKLFKRCHRTLSLHFYSHTIHSQLKVWATQAINLYLAMQKSLIN